jgi:hypothetical protein
MSERIIIPLLLLVGACCNSFGQKKYGPGYYVSNNGDTVKGFIEYRYNYNYSFLFRSTPREKSDKITIDDALAFQLDGGNAYQKLDFALGDLSDKPVFAQTIILGAINMYSYQGRLFVDGGGPNKFRMAKPKAKTTEETKKYYQQNVGYFNILFQDCPAVRTDAATVAISSKRLTDLITRYHQCRQIPFSHVAARQRKRINFGVSLGVAASKIKYRLIDDPNVSYLGRSSFQDSPTSPSIALQFISRGRKLASVFSMQQELIFSNASFVGSSNANWEGGGYEFTETSSTVIKYSKVDYRVGVRITGRSNVLNPYAAVGVAVPLILSVESKSDVTFQINDDVQSRVVTPVAAGLSSVWVSLGISKPVGVKQHLFAEITSENGNLGNGGAYTTLSSRIGFLF